MQFVSEIKVELIDRMGSDLSIAKAAWVSTKGQAAEDAIDEVVNKDKIAGVIGYLIKHRHGTPFEHSAITFRVHAPIFVWREWHRHRVGFSYNEESGRYKQLDPVFYVPGDRRRESCMKVED